MTLLDIDGFAHGNTSRYTALTGSLAQTTTPRLAGGAYATGTWRKAIPATTELFVGMGYRTSSFTQTIWNFFGDGETTVHITVMLNAVGLIEVRRGSASGTVIATGTTPLAITTWYYLEARVTINDTTGIVQIRLNGGSTNEISFTGDTKNAGTNSTVETIAGGSGTGTWAADLYALNTSGSANNTWLGDVAVRTLTPNGDGNSSQLLGSDGNSVSNYLQVDDVPYNTTDYNGSATVGQKDTYALSDLPAGVAAVKGVRVNAYMAKSDAGAGSAKIVTRSGGTDYAPTTRALAAGYVEYSEIKETDPATSAAWTTANVNALQVGMEVA